MTEPQLPSEERVKEVTSFPLSSLTLHRHARPPTPPPQQPGQRTSDASDISTSTFISPALIAHELQTSKEHFSNLRFTYLEQITKLNFLQSIIDDESPPDGEDMRVFNEGVKELKDRLGELKRDLDHVVKEIEQTGGDLGAEYTRLESEVEMVKATPAQIRELLDMRKELDSDTGMPLEETLSEVARLEAEAGSLDRDIGMLERKVKAGNRTRENLNRNITALEKERQVRTSDAEEAAREMGEGGRARVKREEVGRWYKVSGEVLDMVVG